MIDWNAVLTGFGLGLFIGSCAGLLNTIIGTLFSFWKA